jgi:hypothetical protein
MCDQARIETREDIMKTIEILDAKPGQTLTIRTQPNDQILGYKVVVDQWKGSKSIFGSWPGTDAETPVGISFQLEPADGYDVVIKAAVRSTGSPQIVVTFLLDGQAFWKGTTDFPSGEAPVVARDWNIFLR